MSFLRRSLVALLLVFFRVKLRFRVCGLENVPKTGPLLVVSNHLSNADPPLLGICLERPAIFMAKQELFRPPLFGYVLKRVGGFPVKRGRTNLEAVRAAYRLLGAGNALVIFPEGSRSRTGGLQVAFRGAAQIAVRARVPVLPVAISGTEVLGRLSGWLGRPKVTINFGCPFYLPHANGRLSHEELNSLTNEIMSSIAGLLPVTYRGEYGHKD
jgi:1-acyl-sn-glycerol-3-phosphate acyltransferase